MIARAPAELAVGGVLVAPFVRDALIALALLLALRPLLRRARIERVFANPPLVETALYVCLLGLVTALI